MAAIASLNRNRAGPFVVLFAMAALTLFAVLLAPPIRPFVDGFSGQLANVSSSLIGALGGTCSHHGAFLENPARGFSMEIRDGCNGVNVVILLWAAMLAYPAGWKWKVAGLGGGLAAIQILNLLRLISLFYLGQYSMPVFEFAHFYLWETLIILDAMVVFGFWSGRAVSQ